MTLPPVMGDRFVLVYNVNRDRWSVEDRQTGSVRRFRSREAALKALKPGLTACNHWPGQTVCDWCRS